MQSKESVEKYTSFNFVVLTENTEAFRACAGKIMEKARNNKTVQAKFIREFLDYITTQKTEENKEIYERCKKACAATINYFSKVKDYTFVSDKNQEKFDFGKFIGLSLNYYIGSMWIMEQMNNVTEKKKTIQTLFEALTVYSRQWNKSSKKEDLFISHYKKTVLAAFITHQLGIHVLNPDKNNQYILNDLYKAAWDYVKHMPQLQHFKALLEPIGTNPI